MELAALPDGRMVFAAGGSPPGPYAGQRRGRGSGPWADRSPISEISSLNCGFRPMAAGCGSGMVMAARTPASSI